MTGADQEARSRLTPDRRFWLGILAAVGLGAVVRFVYLFAAAPTSVGGRRPRLPPVGAPARRRSRLHDGARRRRRGERPPPTRLGDGSGRGHRARGTLHAGPPGDRAGHRPRRDRGGGAGGQAVCGPARRRHRRLRCGRLPRVLGARRADPVRAPGPPAPRAPDAGARRPVGAANPRSGRAHRCHPGRARVGPVRAACPPPPGRRADPAAQQAHHRAATARVGGSRHAVGPRGDRAVDHLQPRPVRGARRDVDQPGRHAALRQLPPGDLHRRDGRELRRQLRHRQRHAEPRAWTSRSWKQ